VVLCVEPRGKYLPVFGAEVNVHEAEDMQYGKQGSCEA